MPWTYSGNPAHSERDHVRFLIGDTDSSDPQLNDAEIDHCLGWSRNAYAAAALGCEALAARYSRQVSKSIGATSVQAGERAKAYAELAVRLSARGGGIRARPRFGGISRAEAAAVLADDDLIQSPIRVEKPSVNSSSANCDSLVVYPAGSYWNRLE